MVASFYRSSKYLTPSVTRARTDQKWNTAVISGLELHNSHLPVFTEFKSIYAAL